MGYIWSTTIPAERKCWNAALDEANFGKDRIFFLSLHEPQIDNKSAADTLKY